MRRNYFMIGMPASGKSTFLAALGYSLLGDCSDDKKYRLGNYNEVEYLTELVEEWSKYQELCRTVIGRGIINVNLPLLDCDDNELNIVLPDQSGEAFHSIVKERQIKHELHDMLNDCDTFLLFINPNKISEDKLIEETEEQYRETEEENLSMGFSFQMHEQAEYVEILQLVEYIRKKRSLYLKVIISAWDEFVDYHFPEKVLKEKLPLVWQFIECHKSKWTIEYWGISAQGGSLQDIEIRQKLMENDAGKRVIVVNQQGEESRDITSIFD